MISLARRRQHCQRANELLSQRWASKDAAGAMMMQRPADHDEVRFAPLIGANQSLSCQLLVVGGGLFGLSAAQAAVLRDIDVGCVWDKRPPRLWMDQFLSGWVKQHDLMVDELTTQEPSKGSRLQHEGVCKTRRRDGGRAERSKELLWFPKSSYDFIEKSHALVPRLGQQPGRVFENTKAAAIETGDGQLTFFPQWGRHKGGQIFTANA
jgi:hypothetical protein